jgi:hypothetical protein
MADVELFVERAQVLRSSTAVPTIDETALHITFTSEGAVQADLDAPDDEATIAYFTRIREFDTPKKAIYVPDFFPYLEAGATPRRRQVVAHLRRAHSDLGRERYDRPSQILGPGATPRDVWELWTYSHLMHLDPDKRAKWAALKPYQQAYAKFISYWYAGDLYHLVTVVEAMLLDKALDDRGVRMQILTINPRFADMVPPFEAAKVRLRID